MFDRWLADGVAGIHFAYIAFIPLGGFLTWRWQRVAWLHLAAVAVGLLSVTAGFECPLTTWEQTLRRRGGEQPYQNGFVEHYLAGKVYPHGYDTVVQLGIIVVVMGAYGRLLIRRRREHA